MHKRYLVTGGAGFIGSAVVRHLVASGDADVLNVDKLTYAGNLDNLDSVASNPCYRFAQIDICDARAIRDAINGFKPDVIMHLAAESHVDRSIDGPGEFIQTNVVGTFTMLQAALAYWRGLEPTAKPAFRFHHISTDEVFGSLGSEGYFHETTPYSPNSPYSASKAASDHLVNAWHHNAQRARGQAHPRLWQWLECPRLALCRRPRARAAPDRRSRSAGPELQCRRQQ
jgi:dTDP-glucose 4,6-dehydratase